MFRICWVGIKRRYGEADDNSRIRSFGISFGQSVTPLAQRYANIIYFQRGSFSYHHETLSLLLSRDNKNVQVNSSTKPWELFILLYCRPPLRLISLWCVPWQATQFGSENALCRTSGGPLGPMWQLWGWIGMRFFLGQSKRCRDR